MTWHTLIAVVSIALRISWVEATESVSFPTPLFLLAPRLVDKLQLNSFHCRELDL